MEAMGKQSEQSEQFSFFNMPLYFFFFSSLFLAAFLHHLSFVHLKMRRTMKLEHDPKVWPPKEIWILK